MAKRTIERDEVVTKKITYEVCDKCGLEPEDGLTPLFESIEVEYFHGPGEYQSRLLLETNATGHVTRGFCVKAKQGETFFAERTPTEPIAEICESCREELFGWTDHND